MKLLKAVVHVLCFPLILILSIPFGIVEIYRLFDKFLDR